MNTFNKDKEKSIISSTPKTSIQNELMDNLQFKPTKYSDIASLHINHSQQNRPYDNIVFSKMIESLGDIGNKQILEFGCGHGYYANSVAKSGAKHVSGVDIDNIAIQTAASENISNATFVTLTDNSSSLSLLSNNGFDVVYAMYVFETINNLTLLKDIFANIYQSLKDGGIFTFQIGNLEEFYGKKCVEFEFPINPIYTVLKDGDPYTARLLGVDEYFDVQDFYFSINTYKNLLSEVGFNPDSILITPYKMTGDEYEGMIDEKDFAPSIVISAIK